MEFRRGLILATVGLLAISGVLAQDPEPPFYSVKKEVALGRSLAGELEDTLGLEEDAAVVELIEAIAGQLARPAGADTSLVVRVLDDQEPQIHPLPGGYLVVRSGLVAAVETEAELAAVLAHAIGHVVARHGTRNVSGVAKASIPVLFLGGWRGACARASSASRLPLAWMKIAGQFEEEADLLAIDYLDRAGYDPAGLADAFDRISVATTPEASRLTAGVRDKAREYSLSGREYVTTSPGFVEVHSRFGQAAPAGYRPPNAARA